MSVFTPPGDPLLQMRATEVPIEEIRSDETQAMIDQMMQVARGERTDAEKRPLIGLAAPQIGIAKRIIIVDIGVDNERKDLGDLMVFINPEIIWSSEEEVDGREGCFSVDGRVAGIVSRSDAIRITAFDRDGMLFVRDFSGFTARIFQHELDHLNGIRFPDRVGKEGKLHWVEESEYPDYRKNWETWERQCSWGLWESMKNPC